MLQVSRGASSMNQESQVCFLISKLRSHLNDCAWRLGGLSQPPQYTDEPLSSSEPLLPTTQHKRGSGGHEFLN